MLKIVLLLITALGLFYNTAYAEQIKIIMGMSPSSTFPIIVRTIADNTPNLKGVAEFRVGQGNLIAYQTASLSKPDGKTVVFASTSVIINPLIHKSASYVLDPLFFIGQVDNAIVVHSSVPYNTVKDLMKSRKDITYGHNGFATQSFLAIELISDKLNKKLTNIPYKGSDIALLDLISGQIDMHLSAVGRIKSYENNSRIKIIATTGSKRSKLFPNVPTVAETIPGFSSYVWYMFMVPPNTPENIKKHLHNQFSESLKKSNVIDVLTSMGIEIPDKPIDMNKFLADETRKWSSVISKRSINEF